MEYSAGANKLTIRILEDNNKQWWLVERRREGGVQFKLEVKSEGFIDSEIGEGECDMIGYTYGKVMRRVIRSYDEDDKIKQEADSKIRRSWFFL